MLVEPIVSRASSVLLPMCSNNAFKAQPLPKKENRVVVSLVLRTADHTSDWAGLRDGVILFFSILSVPRIRLFGSFPSTARMGDVVVVLFRGWVPFVLRPVGEDVFELVWAAYVHGITEGQCVLATLAVENTEPCTEFGVQLAGVPR